MLVRDVMTPRVISIAPTATVAAARQQLRDHRIHHLVVVDDASIVGLLSLSEMSAKSDHLPVSAVMSRDIITVDAEATVRNAASLMIGRTTGCLPVVERGNVAGIVTTTDLMRVVSGGAARPV